MERQQKENIKALVIQKLDMTQVSQNQASKQMGISVATVSNCLNDKWDSISDDMWRIIGQWAGFSPVKWKTKRTRNLDLIQNLCKDAQMNRRFLATAGFSGAGKTTALTHYANTTPGAFYVLCTVTMTRKDFLKAIQKALGLEEFGAINYMLGDITQKLNQMETPLLILDDGGKLSDQCLRVIQMIYDKTEFHSGIVLAGVQAMQKKIWNGAAKDKNGFRELKRRTGKGSIQ